MVRPTINFLNSQTVWAKFGEVRNICFVGRETIGVGDGCYIIFFNLQTKEEKIYTAGDDERGHGVKVLAGHKQLTVFAFCELGAHARIYVLTYPDFNKLGVMTGGTDDGYLCLAFTESEFLLTLNDLPNFAVTIWNWRTGEKIISHPTSLHAPRQLLRGSFGCPLYMAQMGFDTCELHVWDILMCGKRCVLTDHKVTPISTLQRFSATQWTSEGTLFVMDSSGDIFTVTSEYKLDLAIKWEGGGTHQVFFSWYKAGLVVAGPNQEIKHYKKSGGWSCDWTAKTHLAFGRLLSSPRDFLVGVSEHGDIMVYDHQAMEFNFVKEHESCFDDFCMLYPTGEFIISLAHNEEITAWEISTGKLMDSMTLGGPALAMAEHPEYPYFAVAFGHGMLQLFSFYETNTIKLLTSFHLTRNSLSSVAFAESGKLIVTADMSIGEFFVIEGRPGQKMHVVATCCANRQIADYILVASQTCFRLFALNVTSTEFIAGNIITRFCVIRGRPCPDTKDYETDKVGTFYTRLYPKKIQTRDRIFYAQPMDSKALHELEVKRGDGYARFVNSISTNHLMRKIRQHFDDHRVISYGYDGLVCFYTKKFEHKGVIMSHHRMQGGVTKAYVDPTGKYVVSLGRINTLTCVCITDAKVDEHKRTALRERLISPKAYLMFKQPTFGFLPKGEHAGKTWLEVEYLKIFGEEYQKCEKLKTSILKRFKNIRKDVKALLTKNLEGPENEYLDIQEFNLDTELKNQRMIENVQKCKETEIYLRALIVAQDKVSLWIKQFCWDPMVTPGRTIFGIFSDIDVESYTLLPVDFQQVEVQTYIQQYREMESILANADIFEPWVPKTPSEMKAILQRIPSSRKESDESSLTLDNTSEKDISPSEQDIYPNKETQTALLGSTAHHFVTLEFGHYDQQQMQTYLQSEYETALSKAEKIKLREFFNKEFENLMTIKSRDVNTIKERNARLRHIISEINFFSESKLDIIFTDPEWRQEENPTEILEVTPGEISVTPYISPSQQAMLDAEAAERERIRLLMLADDFKERALMAMMNGVLEIRWEDELKKDVPLPKCMIEKTPEDYKEEDIRAVRDYEDKVKFLESERLRYKRMLCAEYAQVGNVVRENVKKFNSRMDELLQLKIQVEAAIDHETLRINRIRLKNHQKIIMNEAEKNALKAISTNEKEIESTQKLISSLSDDMTECRSILDTLTTKDKMIEKAFKKEMQEASPTAQEIASKLYKKRPKTNVRSITSQTVLLELSRCVISKERTPILNTDALDFLKAMDTLDLYVGVPNAVDEHLYAHVCRQRRLKIESEIKIRAATMDITEADTTIATLHKRLTQKKELAHRLVDDLNNIRQDKLRVAENLELQLVIKQGFVEVSLCGEIADFSDAILISRKDIEDINSVILQGGDRKIKAMVHGMHFRRGILSMEWAHKKMKMQIEDLQRHLTEINGIKVTKEIQAYLKSRARGESPDKGLSFETEVDLVKQSYQRIIDERKATVQDLQIKIANIKKNTRKLNKQLSDINVDVCEQKLNVDQAVLDREQKTVRQRTQNLLKRAKLVKQIQVNHNEILVRQTELELLRLRTYPTLKYKIFN